MFYLIVILYRGVLILFGLILFIISAQSIADAFTKGVRLNSPQRQQPVVVDLAWTTVQVASRQARVIYDRNQNNGANLRLIYPSPSYKDVTVEVNDQLFHGIIMGNPAYLSQACCMSYVDPHRNTILAKRPQSQLQESLGISVFSGGQPVLVTSPARYIVVLL